MCAREDGGNQSVRLQKRESDLEEVKAKLDAVLAKDGGNQSVRLQKMESDLEEVKAKLDALLAKQER